MTEGAVCHSGLLKLFLIPKSTGIINTNKINSVLSMDQNGFIAHNLEGLASGTNTKFETHVSDQKLLLDRTIMKL